eukprot:716859-Pyramimonas_sp.AAC.1
MHGSSVERVDTASPRQTRPLVVWQSSFLAPTFAPTVAMGLLDAAALARCAQEIEDMPTFPDDERADGHRVQGSPELKYPRTEEGKGSSSSGKGVASLAS